MIGDFFTKPLQGSLFRRLRDFVMNIDRSDGPASIQTGKLEDHRSVLNDDSG